MPNVNTLISLSEVRGPLLVSRTHVAEGPFSLHTNRISISAGGNGDIDQTVFACC